MKIHQFPEHLTKLRDEFVDHRRFKMGRSETRVKQIKASIDCLYQFMKEKGINEIQDLTQVHIIKFQYYLYQVKHHTAYSTVRHIDNLNLYCRYLHHSNLIWKNPFSGIKYISPPELEKTEIKRYYSFDELIRRWTNHMKKADIYIETVNDKLKSIGLFINFLESKGFKTIYKVDPGAIEEYKKFLSLYQYEPNKYYSPFTQVLHLRWACQFLLYLHRERLIKQDPARYINLRQHYKQLDSQFRANIHPNPKRKEINIPNPEIKSLLEKFINHQLSIGGSKEGTRNYIISAEKLYTFMNSRNITDLRKLTKHDLMDFQSWLSSQVSIKGTKYAPNTIANILHSIRSFFHYLTKYDYLTCDCSTVLELPKGENGIPHSCMTEREVNILLNQPDISNPTGLRDKAIIEVLYSTGIRAKEIAGLRIQDIDYAQGLIRVEDPKGGKSYQRIIPIGKIALEYVQLYITKVRPLLDKANDNPYLFLSSIGQKLYRSNLSSIVRKYLFKCGLRKKITTHSFRVTCATHMLQNNADIRYVQEQLGHRSIRTTQGYTRLVPKDLKRVHSLCHPREKVKISS